MPAVAPAQPKKPRNYLVLAIVLGVFMTLFCLTAAGLGYWANMLKTDLTGTQQQLTDLQGNYESLQADNAKLQDNIEKLKGDITALQEELDTTKKELETTQADLKSSREYSDSLQTRIDAALVRMDVALGIFVDFKNEKGVERDIRKTGDDKLLDLFQTFIGKQNNDNWFNFLAYLFESIVDELQ
jgi:cell division protein FtsB